MSTLKRASQQVAHLGLRVRRGIWGYYLEDPALAAQTGARVYTTSAECVEAARRGERPVALASRDERAQECPQRREHA